MNLNEYIDYLTKPDEGEKPLDIINENCGLLNIFRTVAVVGDSLASGEFESCDENDQNKNYHDMFEYSWGQYMARAAGCTVYNFSRGGMTAKEYVRTFGHKMGFYSTDKAAQAYVIALGVNDIINHKQEIGTVTDIWDGDVSSDTTFMGYYRYLIEQYKAIQPDAKFFLVSMPKGTGKAPEDDRKKGVVNDLLHQLAGMYTNTYVIDLYTYTPANGGDFREKFYMGGHLNPMGYRFMGVVIGNYIDYIIRHNFEDFIQVPFIGVGTHNRIYKW